MENNTNGSFTELKDVIAFFSDFQTSLTETMKIIRKSNESVFKFTHESAATLMEMATLVDPETLIALNNIETSGRKFDEVLSATQEMKRKLQTLHSESQNLSVDHFRNFLLEYRLLGEDNDGITKDKETSN